MKLFFFQELETKVQELEDEKEEILTAYQTVQQAQELSIQKFQVCIDHLTQKDTRKIFEQFSLKLLNRLKKIRMECSLYGSLQNLHFMCQ